MRRRADRRTFPPYVARRPPPQGLHMQGKLPFGNRHPILMLAMLPFFVAAALVAKLFEKPVVRTRSEVADMIQAFIDGSSNDYAWDDFVCGGRIADPALEAIRARCAVLDEEFPATQPGHYCSESGVQVMRGYVQELRSSVP